jgi:hypothetical protein
VTVLMGGGKRVELPYRDRPYDARGSQVDNLCGQFTTFVPDAKTQLGGLMHKVCSGFGWQNDVYHLVSRLVGLRGWPALRARSQDGNLNLHQGRASFKACRSMRGLERLAGVLGLPCAANKVHMVVVSSMLGKRAHVPR